MTSEGAAWPMRTLVRYCKRQCSPIGPTGLRRDGKGHVPWLPITGSYRKRTESTGAILMGVQPFG